MTTEMRRGRTRNFTEEEKEMLIKLIIPFKNYLVNVKVNILPMFLMLYDIILNINIVY